MSAELKEEVLFQRQEEAKTIPLEANQAVLGRVVGTQMQKGTEVYSLLARQKEADLVALKTRASLPLGALVRAEATQFQDEKLGWSFLLSEASGRWQQIEHFEQVERTQTGICWAVDISTHLLPPLERDLLELSTARDHLVENIRRSFPGLPIEPLSESEAEKIARAHWRLDEIQDLKTELESVGVSLTQAKKGFLQAKEVHSNLPRFSVLARWTSAKEVLKASARVRSLQRREVELQETLHRLEHHHGHKVTAEQVRRTISGCHQVHEGLYHRFRELQRESMQCSQELDYGRILVRTLKTLGDREVTLTQTVGVGSKAAPLPVLRDAEAFRLMKTACVRIK